MPQAHPRFTAPSVVETLPSRARAQPSILALALVLTPACAPAPRPTTEIHATPGVRLVVAVQPDGPTTTAPATPRATSAAPVAASANGCADGQREGFVDLASFPGIAGCSGAWTLPGLMPYHPQIAPACPGLAVGVDSTQPACGRAAGDDGNVPSGQGCTVEDLCAAGWHVCRGASEVAQRAAGSCEGATRTGDPPLFFASRQSSNGCYACATGQRVDPGCDGAACTPGCAPSERLSNDIFGCGNFGDPVQTCGPLDRFTNNLCQGLAGSPWSCNDAQSADDSGLCEGYTLVKTGPSHGGVLCCRDD